MIHTGQLAGFPAVTLSNGEVEAVFVPMLGGRLASLKAVGGRSWCFSPGDRLELWANRPGDPFTAGTFVGLDECLPTITACRVDGRDLPDHGSCWNHPWELLPGDGVGLGLDLPDLPLRLERRATLRGTTLRLDYALTNRGDRPERWGWAFHGLLALAPGDRIELPGVESVRVAAQRLAEPLSLPTWTWPSPRPDLHLDTLDLGPGPTFLKAFAGPLDDGHAAVWARDGQGLALRWPAQTNPWCGLWLSRGGYLNQHTLALEPTNLPCDSLEKAGDRAAVLDPGATATWWVEMCLTPPRNDGHRSVGG